MVQPWFKAPAESIHAINPSLSPADCAAAYEKDVRTTLGGATLAGSVPAFDLILLGMGPDGHTASLFPSHPLLTDASARIVAEITDSPKPPPTRVTFTYRLIDAAANVAFVALGEGKAGVVKEIFDESVAPDARLPAARVRQSGGKELPTWFMDAPACSKIA